MKTLVILGSCGSSVEVFGLLREEALETDVIFVDDRSDTTELVLAGQTWPVVKDWDFARVRADRAGGDPHAFTEFLCGPGRPPMRKVLAEKALAHGLKPAPPLVSHRAFVSVDVSIAPAVVVMPFAILGPRTRFESYVLVQNSVVAHDTVVHRYASVHGSGIVAGECVIGEGVTLGLNVTVREKVRIAPWSVCGMQAAVVKDVEEPGTVVMGVPARPAGRVPLP